MTQAIPETPADFGRTRIIQRPSGFFWMDRDNGRDSDAGQPVEEERPRLGEH